MLNFETSTLRIPVWLWPGGTGTPVLLVHGQLWDHDVWLPTIERWAGRRPLACFDLPGHGRAPLPPDCTMSTLATSALEVLDALGWRKAVAIGHSLGAVTILQASRRAPERFSACCHVGLPMPDVPAEMRAQFHAFGDGVQSGFPPGLELEVRSMWYSASYQARHPELAGRIRALLEANDPCAAAAILHAVADSPSTLPLPEPYAIRTWVIGMEEDAVVPLAAAAELVSALRAEVVRLPGGHLVFDEQPEALAATLDRFLDGCA